MENTLSYLLRVISIKYRYYAHNVLGKDRWGITQDLAIYHIAQQKKLNQKDLVSKLNITPASVSNIVNKMKSQGLLLKVQDEKDGRKFTLSLTEKGQDLVSQVIRAWTKIQKDITNEFTENEKTTFFHLLKQLEKKLDKLNQ